MAWPLQYSFVMSRIQNKNPKRNKALVTISSFNFGSKYMMVAINKINETGGYINKNKLATRLKSTKWVKFRKVR